MTDADRFRSMAERIDHNASSTFGGAAVIVPPASGGEPVEILVLDESGDPAQFWSTVSTRIKLVLEKLEQQQNVARGFGVR